MEKRKDEEYVSRLESTYRELADKIDEFYTAAKEGRAADAKGLETEIKALGWKLEEFADQVDSIPTRHQEHGLLKRGMRSAMLFVPGDPAEATYMVADRQLAAAWAAFEILDLKMGPKGDCGPDLLAEAAGRLAKAMREIGEWRRKAP